MIEMYKNYAWRGENEQRDVFKVLFHQHVVCYSKAFAAMQCSDGHQLRWVVQLVWQSPRTISSHCS